MIQEAKGLQGLFVVGSMSSVVHLSGSGISSHPPSLVASPHHPESYKGNGDLISTLFKQKKLHYVLHLSFVPRTTLAVIPSLGFSLDWMARSPHQDTLLLLIWIPRSTTSVETANPTAFMALFDTDSLMTHFILLLAFEPRIWTSESTHPTYHLIFQFFAMQAKSWPPIFGR